MRMGKNKRLVTVLGTLMLGLAVLSACGDSNATPASSGAAVPTGSSNVAATTAAGTGTTAASSNAPATTIIGPNLSGVAGLTEVPVSDSLRQTISKQLNLGTVDLHYYTSDSDSSAAATSIDTALTGQGYLFAIPGMSKPIGQGGASFGVYSNSANGSDVLMVVAPVPADMTAAGASTTGLPGLSADEVNKLMTQVQGHKTFAFTLSGSNLMQGLMSMMATTGGSTTPVTTP